MSTVDIVSKNITYSSESSAGFSVTSGSSFSLPKEIINKKLMVIIKTIFSSTKELLLLKV